MAYFGPHTRFGDLMGSVEARAVIDKYMQGATPYLTSNMPMMDMALQRIVSTFPPEVGKAFIQEIEQCSPDMMHGGRILAKALKQEGVDTVFTLAGDHTMAMYYGLVDEGIRIIDHRHESAAVMAANGYSRASGKPGVVIITAGPGAANAFGGMIDGIQGDLPLLVISGGSPVSAYMTGAMQEFDLIPTYRGICKWAERVYETKRIADYVHIAFRELTTTPKGTAFLEIPYDILNDVAPEICAKDPGCTHIDPVIPGNTEAVEAAVDLLSQAKKPVVVIGREARFYPEDMVYAGKLADYLNAPVYNMWESQGFFENEADPRYQIGPVATGLADVIVTVNLNPDYMYSFMAPPAWNPYAKVIAINANAKYIGFNRSIDVGIVGTPGYICKQIFENYSSKNPANTDSSFLTEVFTLAGQLATNDENSDAVPVNPKHAGKEIKTFMEKHSDWGIVSDGGDATSNYVPMCTYPGQWCFESRFGGIGTALPMAIGAYYGHGNKMLMVTGDGSLGFYLGELTTAITRNIPLIIVVLNDSCWGMIKGMEHVLHGDVLKKYCDKAYNDIALHLDSQIRYDKVCEGLGGYGELVTKPEDIIPALERAEASGKVSVINVITADQTEPGVMGSGTAMYGVEFKPMVKF